MIHFLEPISVSKRHTAMLRLSCLQWPYWVGAVLFIFPFCRSQSTERLCNSSPSHSGVSGNAGWRGHLCVKPSTSLPLSAALLGHVASSAKKPHTLCSGSPERRVTNGDGVWFIHSTGMKHTPYRRQPCRQSAFPFGAGYHRKRSRVWLHSQLLKE